MFTQSLISLVTLSSVLLPTAFAAPGPAWIRRQEDAQSSLTLDPATISHGLEQDGQGANPDPGQVRSLTSSNNFINFCLGPLANGVPLTNGKQITTGSCNQTPMGRIISLDKAPRSKFVFPKNGDESLVENTAFTVQMKIINMQTGNFVNAQANYYAAPQQVNGDGVVIGHSHVVIEKLPSLQTTEPLDPTTFAFFKGLNNVAANDILTADVTSGLAAGVYRICSINTAANHQPALVSNAQHGSLDDCSYFTVKAANDVSSSSSSTSATETTVSTSTSSSTTASTTQTADAQSTSTDSTSTSTTASTTQTADAQSTSTSTTASTTQTADAQSTSTDSTSTSTTASTTQTADEQSTSTESSSATESTSTGDSSSDPAPTNLADSQSAQPEVTSSSSAAPTSSSPAGEPSSSTEAPSSDGAAPSPSDDSSSDSPSESPAATST